MENIKAQFYKWFGVMDVNRPKLPAEIFEWFKPFLSYQSEKIKEAQSVSEQLAVHINEINTHKKLDSNDYTLIRKVISAMNVAKEWRSSDYNRAGLVIFEINQHFEKPNYTEIGRKGFINKIRLLIKIWKSL